jgi:predicted aconitase with swiveling domain
MAEAQRVVVAGSCEGPVLVLDESLSFWGGFEYETGTIIDQAHPQVSADLAGNIVMMPVGRGSSSASSVLAEAIRRGTAPVALILLESDEIVALGAIIAEEMYGITMPILIVDRPTYNELTSAKRLAIDPEGRIETSVG